jgi:hypothetical protein
MNADKDTNSLRIHGARLCPALAGPAAAMPERRHPVRYFQAARVDWLAAADFAALNTAALRSNSYQTSSEEWILFFYKSTQRSRR